jgi:signal peptidase I
LGKFGKFLLWTTIIVGVIVGALRLFLVRTWTIPGDDPSLSASIAPSLEPGDTVLLFHAMPPSFGDLVRCADPDEPRRWVIGRIVGEGGDTIEIEHGRLTINGRKAPLESACKESKVQVPHPNTGSPVELHCNLEEIGSVLHKRAMTPGQVSTAAPVKRTVAAGFFFLVSDNRAFQNDSTTYGPVPVESCDARIIFRFWGTKGFGDVQTRFAWIH